MTIYRPAAVKGLKRLCNKTGINVFFYKIKQNLNKEDISNLIVPYMYKEIESRGGYMALYCVSKIFLRFLMFIKFWVRSIYVGVSLPMHPMD